MTDFAAIKAQTQDVYERQAKAWDKARLLDLKEKDWLDRALSGLPSPAAILDLGCGSGRPIGSYVTSLGHNLTGVDTSPTMIELARAYIPDATWKVMDIRALDFPTRFDAIISWDGFFHLSPAEQRTVLPQLATLLNPGGNLLLTVGYGEGEVTGTVAGETVYHGSLSTTEYLSILETSGFDDVSFTPNDETVLGRYVLFASGKT